MAELHISMYPTQIKSLVVLSDFTLTVSLLLLKQNVNESPDIPRISIHKCQTKFTAKHTNEQDKHTDRTANSS